RRRATGARVCVLPACMPFRVASPPPWCARSVLILDDLLTLEKLDGLGKLVVVGAAELEARRGRFGLVGRRGGRLLGAPGLLVGTDEVADQVGLAHAA